MYEHLALDDGPAAFPGDDPLEADAFEQLPDEQLARVRADFERLEALTQGSAPLISARGPLPHPADIVS